MAAPVLATFAASGVTGAADIPITAPSGIASGDLIVVYVEANTAATTWTAPDGTWTQRSTSSTGAVFTKVSSGSEPSSWTFTKSIALGNGGGHAVRITGPGAFSDSAVLARGARSSAVLPSITASTANTLLVQFIYDYGGVGTPYAPPATATEVYDNTLGAIGHEVVGGGATGTRTWTYNANSNSGGAIIAISDPAQGTIQRASTLYPVNTTTVDTGTGIDVRLLSNDETGADDSTQTATFTHTNDNVERTFDPATGGVTNTNNANTTLFKAGWALRLSQDMTATDDTNCDIMLTGGTVTVSLRVTAAQSGGTYVGGTLGPTFKASLWKYNPSTDTGSLIAAGTTTATTWSIDSTTGDLGTAKTATISITVPTTTFSAGTTAAEVLYLQVGFLTNNVPNPSLGTATYTMTLTVDNTNTKVVYGSGVNLIQYCSFTKALNGVGTVTKNALSTTIARSLTGVGTPTFSRVPTISKTFSLTGVGTPTYSKVTTAFRTFDMSAHGTILTSGSNASTVTVPIDEIPEAGAGGGDTYIFPVLD